MKKLTELQQIKKKNDKEQLLEFITDILTDPNAPKGYYGTALEYLFNFSGRYIGIMVVFKLGYIQAMQDFNIRKKTSSKNK